MSNGQVAPNPEFEKEWELRIHNAEEVFSEREKQRCRVWFERGQASVRPQIKELRERVKQLETLSSPIWDDRLEENSKPVPIIPHIVTF